MQLIPTGGLHIRRPLLERRFARSTAIQLKAVEDNFASELSAMRIGPTLSMEETENGELRVRIGVNDPEHVLLDTDFPEIVLDLDPTGSASEVRKRVARAVQEQKTLTQGLRKFLTDTILGLRPKEEEEGEEAQGRHPQEESPKAASEAGPDADAGAGESQRMETGKAQPRETRQKEPQREQQREPQRDLQKNPQQAPQREPQRDSQTARAPQGSQNIPPRSPQIPRNPQPEAARGPRR